MHRHRGTRKRRRQQLMIFGVAIVVIVAAAILIPTLAGKRGEDHPTQDSLNTQQNPDTPTSAPETGQNSDGQQNTDQGQNQDTQAPGDTQPDKDDTQDENAGETSAPSTDEPVPVAAAVGDDYFTDALFIGDSRTEGFMLYTDVQADSYTATGLNVDTALSKAVVKQKDGSKLTIPEALKTKKYGKIYVAFGINELGWVYSSVFIDKYEELLGIIKQAQPDAVIYVQSILPVSAKKSASSTFTNEKIVEYNKLIFDLAKKMGVYYLAVNESMEGPDGALPSDAASDGIHLKKSYCIKWFDYLKTHTVQA